MDQSFTHAGEVIPDNMQLFDNYIPGILDGTYRITATQSINVDNQDHNYMRDQLFIVKGPRFQLPADEFHALSPSDGSMGDFSRILPHIVIRKRALPWERRFDHTGKLDYPNPWLALIVLSAEEMKACGGQLEALTTMTPKALLNIVGTHPNLKRDPSGKYYLPYLGGKEGGEGAENDDKTQVLMLNIPFPLFNQVRPQISDLPYLAHLRCVDPLNKPKIKMHAPGDFSVILANRFPQDGVNHAFLVSLEGWEYACSDAKSKPCPNVITDKDWMRMIVLKTWTINSNATSVHTFGEIVENINNDLSLVQTDELLLEKINLETSSLKTAGKDFNFRLPLPTAKQWKAKHSTSAKDKKSITHYLSSGYVPIEYRPHKGTRTVSWFRGPFSPIPVKSNGQGPYSAVDEALIFDEASGVFDVSYSSAWQLGCSLALSSPSICTAMRKYMKDQKDQFDGITVFEQLLKGKGLNGLATLHDMGQLWRSEIAAAAGAVPSKNPVVMADHLMEWLAQLALLEMLPYDYMIPDQRLLPHDSLRFFHVDNNWIDALVDGALSVSVECSRDQLVHKENRAGLESAISKIVYQYRLEVLEEKYLRLKNKFLKKGETSSEAATEALKKIEAQLANIVTKESLETFINADNIGPSTNPSADYLSKEKTGFILRSELVTGWPGVEIDIEDAEGKKLTPLRYVHLAHNLLLCIVVGKIGKVIFREPPEGLRFGVDEEDSIMLRHLSGTAIGSPFAYDASTHPEYKIIKGEILAAAPDITDEQEQKLFGIQEFLLGDGTSKAKGVLDISTLKKLFTDSHLPLGTDFGPATFGLQLLRSPDRKEFDWK